MCLIVGFVLFELFMFGADGLYRFWFMILGLVFMLMFRVLSWCGCVYDLVIDVRCLR